MSKLKHGFDSDFLWGGAISCSQADGAWNEAERESRRRIVDGWMVPGLMTRLRTSIKTTPSAMTN